MSSLQEWFKSDKRNKEAIKKLRHIYCPKLNKFFCIFTDKCNIASKKSCGECFNKLKRIPLPPT